MQVLIATGDPADPFRPVEVSEAIESLAHHQVKFQQRLEALEKAPESGEKTKLENAADLREAIGVLAVEVVRLKEVQAAQGSLLAAIDERTRLQQVLLDIQQQIFIDHGWAPPRPNGDPLAN